MTFELNPFQKRVIFAISLNQFLKSGCEKKKKTK